MTPWLDFSGAPPLLIPAALVPLWRGCIDRSTGKYRDADPKHPTTDYDRACAAAWPGRGLVAVGDSTALVLYSEWDEVAWDQSANIVACGSWWPNTEQLNSASWGDPLLWKSTYTEYLLINSAADGSVGLRADDYFEIQLPLGACTLEYAQIDADFIGGFHRFDFAHASTSA
jgi:hypothetical protein